MRAVALLLAAVAAATFLGPIGRAPAVELAAQDERAAFSRSLFHEQSQRYREAIDALAAVHRARPRGYAVNLRLGWLHYLAGRHGNALRHYEAAIRAMPGAIEPRLGYLLPLLALDRFQDAEAAARQVLAADPRNYLASLRLAYALRRQSKNAQAAAVAESLSALYPTDVSFLLESALAREALGEGARAASLFEQVLLLEPENPTARRQLGRP